MATETSVLVQEPALVDATSKIDNTLVATGAGNVKRQVTVIGDESVAGARVRVKNTRPDAADYGLATRQVQPNYNSVIGDLPTASTAVTGSTTDVIAVFLSNQTDEVQHVSITDGNDEPYLWSHALEPREVKVIPFGGMRFISGIKWFAGNSGAVRGQIKGEQ